MKKILFLFLAIVLAFSLAACGTTENQESSSSETPDSSSTVPDQETPDSNSPVIETSEPEQPETSGEPASNILVAYFSWADNADLESGMDAVASPSVVSPGNVQQLAGWVQEETGGRPVSIRVVQPYPASWDACLARANQERGEQRARHFRGCGKFGRV